MSRKSQKANLDFNIVHDMAVAFASARMIDYKYPNNMNRDELRESRYSNFLADYAYVITQYQKAVENPSSDSTTPTENSLNISVTLFDSILKLNANSD